MVSDVKERLNMILQNGNARRSSDGTQFRLHLPVHPDNLPALAQRLTLEEGKYFTPWVRVDSIQSIMALEGPIFRSAPQLLHMSMVIEGLKQGYLLADPMTFAEEFDATGTDTRPFRQKIFANWERVLPCTDATIAFTEYGLGYDPGVIIGALMQLSQRKPVLGVYLRDSRRSDDVFANSITPYTITPRQAISISRGGEKSIRDLLRAARKMDEPPVFPSASGQRTYDVLLVYERTIEAIVAADRVKHALEEAKRTVTSIGQITSDFNEHMDAYDLAKKIAKANQIVVLADDSAESGVLGASALYLASHMRIPAAMLRGDFRDLSGEGTGGGTRQPPKGVFDVANLMVENLLPNGSYTKIAALAEDLHRITRP